MRKNYERSFYLHFLNNVFLFSIQFPHFLGLYWMYYETRKYQCMKDSNTDGLVLLFNGIPTFVDNLIQKDQCRTQGVIFNSYLLGG